MVWGEWIGLIKGGGEGEKDKEKSNKGKEKMRE